MASSPLRSHQTTSLPHLPAPSTVSCSQRPPSPSSDSDSDRHSNSDSSTCSTESLLPFPPLPEEIVEQIIDWAVLTDWPGYPTDVGLLCKLALQPPLHAMATRRLYRSIQVDIDLAEDCEGGWASNAELLQRTLKSNRRHARMVKRLTVRMHTSVDEYYPSGIYVDPKATEELSAIALGTARLCTKLVALEFAFENSTGNMLAEEAGWKCRPLEQLIMPWRRRVGEDEDEDEAVRSYWNPSLDAILLQHSALKRLVLLTDFDERVEGPDWQLSPSISTRLRHLELLDPYRSHSLGTFAIFANTLVKIVISYSKEWWTRDLKLVKEWSSVESFEVRGVWDEQAVVKEGLREWKLRRGLPDEVHEIVGRKSSDYW